ncbi:MAG: hypothetical protein ABTR54_01020 [Candidatus Competibacter sp.]
MMGWLAVMILIFGALSLIHPTTLQQGWQVGVAGLLIGGLAGILIGEALGYGLARREQARKQQQELRDEQRVRDAATTSVAPVSHPKLGLESSADAPETPARPTPRTPVI